MNYSKNGRTVEITFATTEDMEAFLGIVKYLKSTQTTPEPQSKRWLTPEEKRRHIESDGMSCPYCGSEDWTPELERAEDSGLVNQYTRCRNCSRQWTDIFQIVDVQEINTD